MPDCPFGCSLKVVTLAIAVLPLLADAAGRRGPDVAPVAGTLPAGPIELVTAGSTGGIASANSTTCAVSADGRRVLVSSDATNLVPGDTNGKADLFLKDLDTGALQRVTTQSNGAQLAAGGNCLGTTMTPDARLAAFNAAGAVYVKNLQTGELTQASPPAGTVSNVLGFFGGVLSDDGRTVVFLTQPETRYVGAYTWVNVVPARLMLRDLDSGRLETLNTDNGVVADGEVIGTRFAISPDGTRVAFVSSSATLVPGDGNARPDVFVRNVVTGETTLVSSGSDGTASTAVQYGNPTFVSDAAVAFAISGTSSLGTSGLYLKDLDTGVLQLLLSSAQGGATDGRLSGDARKLVFQRLYSGSNGRVFVRDIATGEEALVSASASGTPNNNTATGAIVSRDGSTVVFQSNARNLVSPRPPAGSLQVYAKTIGDGSAP